MKQNIKLKMIADLEDKETHDYSRSVWAESTITARKKFLTRYDLDLDQALLPFDMLPTKVQQLVVKIDFEI